MTQPLETAKIFSTLGQNGINIEMITQGASEINLSFTVKQEESDKAVRILHGLFFW